MQHGLSDLRADASCCCTPWPARPTVPDRAGAVERAGHHRAGARRRRDGRHHPDGQQRRGGRAGRGRVPLRAGGRPQLRPARRRRPLRAGLLRRGQRRRGVHPDDRDPPGGRGHRRHPRRARASTPSTSGRPTCRSPTVCRRRPTTRATPSTARWPRWWPRASATASCRASTPRRRWRPSATQAGFRMITVGNDAAAAMAALRKDAADARSADHGSRPARAARRGPDRVSRVRSASTAVEPAQGGVEVLLRASSKPPPAVITRRWVAPEGPEGLGPSTQRCGSSPALTAMAALDADRRRVAAGLDGVAPQPLEHRASSSPAASAGTSRRPGGRCAGSPCRPPGRRTSPSRSGSAAAPASG